MSVVVVSVPIKIVEGGVWFVKTVAGGIGKGGKWDFRKRRSWSERGGVDKKNMGGGSFWPPIYPHSP